ncbi:MAG: hypothetical protein Q9221_004201 [Calogaya cf. arnoldii]
MKTLAAPILALTVITTPSVLTPRAVNCNGQGFELSVENWKKLKVDASIRAFWHGGEDAEGVTWPGADSYRQPKKFTTLLGTNVQNKDGWTYAMQNHNGIGIGQQGADSAAFGIATDFVEPKKEPDIWFKHAFASAAAALGILGSLPATAWTGWFNGANAVRGLIDAEINANLKGPTCTASAFSSAIQLFAKQARESLESANTQILDNAINIISGGQWVVAPPFKQNDVAEFYRRNMISRGVNAIWRQYPVYVYYVWLDDPKGTKCDKDRSGPQALKYCADDGVYYLYMYTGKGIDWPWGGPKLAAPPYNINPIWAIESSARSLKAQGINYDPSKVDASKFLGASNFADYLNSPERLEGTWTLPVCDGSSHINFNVDYLNQRKVDLKDGVGMPPCICGIDGRDTATFVKAANLDTKKMARMCFEAFVRGGTKDWPASMEGIAYGEDGKNLITKGAIEGCRRGSGASSPTYCNEMN